MATMEDHQKPLLKVEQGAADVRMTCKKGVVYGYFWRQRRILQVDDTSDQGILDVFIRGLLFRTRKVEKTARRQGRTRRQDDGAVLWALRGQRESMLFAKKLLRGRGKLGRQRTDKGFSRV